MAKAGERDYSGLEKEHKSLASHASALCDESVRQLEHLIETEGVKLGFPIQSRVKEWSSLLDKLDRLSRDFSSVTEVQDLIGLRVVLLFKRDVAKVARLLEENFEVVRSYDTSDNLKADQFGYSSVHFVIQLPKEWLEVPTMASLGEFLLEVQVRTLAQHIWAEASHRLQYKDQSSVPPSIVRSIYRASAILETVDLELERVLQEREAYRASVLTEGEEGALNVDSLEKTLDSLLPASNKSGDENYANLLDDLEACGIETQEQLIDLVNKKLPAALERDKQRVKETLAEFSEFGELDPGDIQRVRKGIFFAYTGLVRTMLDLEFDYQVRISSPKE